MSGTNTIFDVFMHLELHNYTDSVVNMLVEVWGSSVSACADPESSVEEGKEGTNTTLSAGHHWPISETPSKWRFAGGTLMAH